LQVYRAMPDIDIKWPGIIDTKFTLRPGTYDQENGSFHYFGAFGYSLPLPNQYYSDAYDWLSQQDAEILEEGKRPAFISWWDYGFEASNRGDHPTVADNFQNGYQLAGSFLMAQNDSEAMGLLIARILEGAYSKEGKLNPKIVSALESKGVSAQKLEDILKNPSSYVSIVLASPDRYGNFSKDLTTFNAKYAAMRAEVSTKAKGESLHELWRDLRSVTGWDVKYFAVDSRLMVFGGQETGIFYAPAKLADKRMKGSDLTMPQDFFEIKAVSDVGTEYEPDEVPPGVNLNSQNPYKIIYKRPFYNSMLYRAFVGYGPEQVNRSETNAGIPGLQGSGDMATLEPKQAHMMKHWRVAYKSAYWNPHDEKNVSKHQKDWEAVEWHVAQERIKSKNGTVIQGSPDTTLWRQNGGVSILRYYDGAVLDGVVRTSSNRVVAGARVTATDEQNVPHDSVVSDGDGRFRLILPFGNITVSASNGGALDFVAMKEKTELGKMTLNVTLEEADRRPLDRDRDGTLDWQYAKDLIVKESTLKGRIFLDTDLNGAYSTADTLLKSQSFTVSGGGSSVPAKSDDKGDYLVPKLSPGQHDFSLVYNGRPVDEKLFATVGPGETSSKDWLVKVGSVKGNISDLPADRGLEMRLVGDGRTVTTPIGRNGTSGSFEFQDLNPGVYTVQVDSPELTVGVKRVTVKLGSATSVDLQSREGVALKVRALAQTPEGIVPAAYA
ncbi:MAG TPA: carboxypeptidase regulatory-like domain-containing protein, partial [Thermoplasmata archaeon]|nr:carboxypeptidase regulatory-like domain-containing protein [Thermoplasmata archaeon]